MQQRSLLTVGLLSIFTFGIYSIVWFVKTKGELNARGAQIPTAWFLIIPFVNIYWMWRYYEAAEQATNGQSNALLNFLLGLFVSSIIPQLLLQNEYNKLSGVPAMAAPAAAPAMAPDQTAIPPVQAQPVMQNPAPAAPVEQPPQPTDQNTPQPPLVQ